MSIFSLEIKEIYISLIMCLGHFLFASNYLIVTSEVDGLFNTDFCIQFRITLKSIRSQCHGQRKTLNMQLNLRPVRRIELNTKVCTVTCRSCPGTVMVEESGNRKVLL